MTQTRSSQSCLAQASGAGCSYQMTASHSASCAVQELGELRVTVTYHQRGGMMLDGNTQTARMKSPLRMRRKGFPRIGRGVRLEAKGWGEQCVAVLMPWASPVAGWVSGSSSGEEIILPPSPPAWSKHVIGQFSLIGEWEKFKPAIYKKSPCLL